MFHYEEKARHLIFTGVKSWDFIPPLTAECKWQSEVKKIWSEW